MAPKKHQAQVKTYAIPTIFRLFLSSIHGRVIVVRSLAGFARPHRTVAAPARSVPQFAIRAQSLIVDKGVLRLKNVFSLKFSAALDLRLVACTLLAARQ